MLSFKSIMTFPTSTSWDHPIFPQFSSFPQILSHLLSDNLCMIIGSLTRIVKGLSCIYYEGHHYVTALQYVRSPSTHGSVYGCFISHSQHCHWTIIANTKQHCLLGFIMNLHVWKESCYFLPSFFSTLLFHVDSASWAQQKSNAHVWMKTEFREKSFLYEDNSSSSWTWFVSLFKQVFENIPVKFDALSLKSSIHFVQIDS